MEVWGVFRYALPALGGGIAVYALIYFAQKPIDKNECFAGWVVNSIMVLGTLMFLALTPGLFFNNPPDDGLNDDIWLKPFFICINLIFLWMTPDTYFRRFSWNKNGLTINRFLKPTKYVEWKDISELKYKPFAQYWRIGFKDGTGAMFYDMMRGSKELINVCEKHAKL